MSLVTIVLVLIAVALLCWAVSAFLPIGQPWKNIILFLIVLLAVVFILRAAGVV